MKIENQQECIPVGCVPTAAVTTTRCHYRGVCPIPLDAEPLWNLSNIPQDWKFSWRTWKLWSKIFFPPIGTSHEGLCQGIFSYVKEFGNWKLQSRIPPSPRFELLIKVLKTSVQNIPHGLELLLEDLLWTGVWRLPLYQLGIPSTFIVT